MLNEFRKFIARGNVLDLAVAVIMGAAFGSIITSIVQDLITPGLGLLGDRDFSGLYLVLKGNVPPGTPYESAKSVAVVLGYGAFLTAVINFIIIAVVIFWIVQFTNRLQQHKTEDSPAKASALTKQEQLLVEIRDLLKAQRR